MRIALDISPIKTGFLQHKVRGTGFYTKNLRDAFLQYHPENEYQFFTQGEKIQDTVDIIHYPSFDPFFLTLPINKLRKTVVTIHDLTPVIFPKEFPAGLKGKLKWQIQRYSLKTVSAIITDSESSKRDIMRLANIPEEKIHVIYLATSNDFKKIQNKNQLEAIKQKYHLPSQFVLYVGDVTWNKNLPRLVQAIKNTHIPLVMVGRALVETKFDRSNLWNKDRILVQDLIKDTKQFIRLGFVSKEDLIVLYNAATCFAMPSLYEGFGLPILEAMNCGCPIITTREASLPEVAGDAAYYVDGYSSEDIKKGIQEVFTNENLRNSLTKKESQQVKRFSWKKTADETIAVYEKIY